MRIAPGGCSWLRGVMFCSVALCRSRFLAPSTQVPYIDSKNFIVACRERTPQTNGASQGNSFSLLILFCFLRFCGRPTLYAGVQRSEGVRDGGRDQREVPQGRGGFMWFIHPPHDTSPDARAVRFCWLCRCFATLDIVARISVRPLPSTSSFRPNAAPPPHCRALRRTPRP